MKNAAQAAFFVWLAWTLVVAAFSSAAAQLPVRGFWILAALACAWFALRAMWALVAMARLRGKGGRYVPAGEPVSCRRCGTAMATPTRQQLDAGLSVRWCGSCGERHEFGDV